MLYGVASRHPTGNEGDGDDDSDGSSEEDSEEA